MSTENNRPQERTVRFEFEPPPGSVTLSFPHGFDAGVGWEVGTRYVIVKCERGVRLVREEP